ncbi:MAG TPA: RNA polymerase sigma factor [Gammaproteobacteria bacterium]|nr:RNA polymerase sigma factor [Gammaproteobacteria bacterium]
MADEPESAAVEDPRAAFVTGVFLRFQHSLLRYLRDLLSRREDAEDVAQETYLKLVHAGGLEHSEVRVRAFMFKVATNLAYDRFRQRRSRGRQDDSELVALPDDAPAADRVVALEQGLSIVERTLLGLPARCRQVFLLRVAHEWSYEAIAERLEVSKRTVEREMQTALEACERNHKKGELP